MVDCWEFKGSPREDFSRLASRLRRSAQRRPDPRFDENIRIFDGNGKPLLTACQIGTIENRYQPVAK